ncbi:hypothetical protein BV22DRAFT_1093046 [Leucogyrophana mollusca]|uniref:Uncharacterized protein n=1 Tax=Leucogyrophana mollusca TaxID=85980 RepID=A0ACB8BDX3_9AGAM|nr:hypothetical protein BV22DRAFT_1093046 [Leucogyrophana mollusca]
MTVIHRAGCSTDWPDNVKDVAKLLSYPLPAWLFTGPYPPASDEECELMALLGGVPQRPPSASDDEPWPSESRTVKSYFHLVLSTVADLRVLVQHPECCHSRSTTSLWLQFVETLARALSDDFLLLEDAPFILPRAQDGSHLEQGQPDAVATLLVSHVVDPPLPSDAHSHGYMDIESVSTKDDYSASSADSIDLPFQAHILPGRGRRFCAVLPVLLVADSDTIVPLIRSTLYQRRVWGIQEPVVGIEVLNGGTAVKVVFGWLDSPHHQKDEDELPIDHLACGVDTGYSDPSLGIFDLTHPMGAFSFAQFILGLRHHFQAIIDATSIEYANSCPPLLWRSDLVDFKTRVRGQSTERVARWTHDVLVQTSASENSSSSSASLHTPSPTDSASALPTYFTEGMDVRDLSIVEEEDERALFPNEGKIRESRPETPRRSTRQVPKSQFQLPVEPSEMSSRGRQSSRGGSSSQSKKTKSLSKPHTQEELKPQARARSLSRSSATGTTRLANSVFATMTDTGLDNDLSISNWLFERGAFTIGRIRLPGETAEEKDINEKIAFYDEMTAFSWPDSWKSEKELPAVDKDMETYRTNLFEGYLLNRNSISGSLGDDDTDFISNRLSALLGITHGAYSREAASNDRSANEAERRNPWDVLFTRFYMLQTKHSYNNFFDVLLERTLNCPRNPAADDFPVFFKSQIPLVAQYLAHCGAALKMISQSPSISATLLQAMKQAASASNLATNFQTAIFDRSMDSQALHASIRHHSTREPETGRCDVILVAPCPDLASSIRSSLPRGVLKDKFLHRFALIRHPGYEDGLEMTGESPNVEESRSADESVPAKSRPVHLQTSLKSSKPVAIQDKLADREKYLENSFSVNPSPLVSSPTPERAQDGRKKQRSQRNHDLDLLLPVLVAEYKKKSASSVFQSMNQTRIYCVSSLKFLEAIGVTNQPVFGLVVCGTQGVLWLAWSNGQKTFIMERNVRQYDLQDPLQTLQLAIFLSRLSRHGAQLQAIVRAKQGEIIDRAKEMTLPAWSKISQIDEQSPVVKAVVDPGQTTALAGKEQNLKSDPR